MKQENTEQSAVDIKMRAAASAAARSVPEDQIEDVIKWTENYLETLKSRTLVSPTDMWTARVCKRVVELEYALRDIALFVSVGGYNDYTLPEDIAQRIKDGIIALSQNSTNQQQPHHQ